jgi:hypothetical protein
MVPLIAKSGTNRYIYSEVPSARTTLHHPRLCHSARRTPLAHNARIRPPGATPAHHLRVAVMPTHVDHAMSPLRARISRKLDLPPDEFG